MEEKQLALVWASGETSCDFYDGTLDVLQPTQGRSLIAEYISPIQMRKYHCDRPREMSMLRLLWPTEFKAK